MLYVAIAILLFVAMLVVRGMLFIPKVAPTPSAAPVAVDREKALAHLQALIRIPTVSYRDKALEDNAPFEELPERIKELYPALNAACPMIRPGQRSILFHWKGRKEGAPSVLMAHYDVVPVVEEGWEKPAFDGIVENDTLWGRGTLDTKGTLVGILEAAESLIQQGFTPEHDLYLAFAGDEEISGDGAPCIIRYLQERGITPAFVLDEGGAVVENVFPSVHCPAALVGTGEKGPMDVRMVLETKGGHASTPPAHSPVGRLAQAVAKVESHPFPFTLTPPVKEMFDTLGRHSSLLYRVIFANLWCFAPVLNLLCKKSGGELNALVRTTVAFTRMEGSDAYNVLPPKASVGANLRLIGQETPESACQYLRKVIGDEDIQVEAVMGMSPSPVSPTDGKPWQRLCSAIAATWPDAVVSPYLMLACSDARHYSRFCPNVYRFSAMALSKEERGMIHGNNERIPLETLYTTVAFFQRMIQGC